MHAPVSAQVLGLLKYDGGGDWYANPTALNNLSNYYNKATNANSYVFPQLQRLPQSQYHMPLASLPLPRSCGAYHRCCRESGWSSE